MDAESTSIRDTATFNAMNVFYNDYLRAKKEWPFPRWKNDKIIKFYFYLNDEDQYEKLRQLGEPLF